MARYRMVLTEFWRDPFTLKNMSADDRYFYVYLLTNEKTTQIGVYKITDQEMALGLGYSVKKVQKLMKRLIEVHKLIRYNPETSELAIKDWGKMNLHKGGKPIMDCIKKELKAVKDTTLLSYVCEGIEKEEIIRLYESYFTPVEEKEMIKDTYQEGESNEADEKNIRPETKTGEKPIDHTRKKEHHPNIEDQPLRQKTEETKEIIEFWDNNGFGLSNINAKEQLLSWLDDSSFLQPKDVILKAMSIACANNKRRLNYVIGILKNWENESLLTVEEIDSYQEDQPYGQKPKQTESLPTGRPIPGEFVLDITAGEG